MIFKSIPTENNIFFFPENNLYSFYRVMPSKYEFNARLSTPYNWKSQIEANQITLLGPNEMSRWSDG